MPGLRKTMRAETQAIRRRRWNTTPAKANAPKIAA
jgi:hypothetical protein